MATQSRWSCVLLYVALLFAMKVFDIDSATLLERPEFGEEQLTAISSAGRFNQVIIPLLFLLSGLMLLSAGDARRLMVRRPAILIFLLVMTLLFLASIAVSDHTMLAVKRAGSQLLFLGSIFCLVLVIQEKSHLYLTIGYAFLTALFVDVALYLSLGTGFSETGGFIGYHNSKNVAGNQYGMATMVFLYLAITRKHPLFLLAAAVAAGLLLLSESKTSMGAIGVFLVLSLLYRFALARGVIVLSTLVGALVLSVMFSLGGNDPEAFTGRGAIWNFLSDVVWRQPFLGYGFLTFWDVGPQSISLTEATGFVQYVNTAHNGFIDVLLGTGLIGLTVVVGFLLAAALMLARLDSRYFLTHYLFIAFMISNVTESYLLYYQNTMWLMFVLMIGAAYTESRSGRRGGVRRRVAVGANR